MVTLLLENGQVVTTVTRAKELRSIADKMITLGKKSLEEVIQKLHSLGLDLKKDEE
jgi:ribosomal protein L17